MSDADDLNASYLRCRAPHDEMMDGALQQKMGDDRDVHHDNRTHLTASKASHIDSQVRNFSEGDSMSTVNDRYEDRSVPSKLSERNDHFDNRDSKILKASEIWKLREELMKAKTVAEEEKSQRKKFEERLRELDQKLNGICSAERAGSKHEKLMEEENSALKSKLRELRDEAEELRGLVSDNAVKMEEYRAKYMQAQQEAEEYKRQLDIIDFDNKQVSDQIQTEIQRVKMQFQEKLQELSPLPDLLKGSQIQLQEAKQLQQLAEESCQHLSSELSRVKEKLVVTLGKLNQEKADKNRIIEDNKLLKLNIERKEKETEDLNSTVEELRDKITRCDEKANLQEQRLKVKSSELTKLSSELQDLKEENLRAATRTKDRAEAMRRYHHTQIAELERQLVQSRAQKRACQKEKDEMRQRIFQQVNSLQENYELCEIRLRGLQGQVAAIKNSCSLLLADDPALDFKVITGPM